MAKRQPKSQPSSEILGDLEEQNSGGRIQAGELKKLLRYLMAYPALLWGGLALILAATAAGLLEPRIFGYAIDEAILPKRLDRLQTMAVAFLFVEVVRFVSTIAQGYLFTLLGQRVMQRLRLELLSHLQRLPISL